MPTPQHTPTHVGCDGLSCPIETTPTPPIPTPRVDLFEWSMGNHDLTQRELEILNFARALEQECAGLRAAIKRQIEAEDALMAAGNDATVMQYEENFQANQQLRRALSPTPGGTGE
jgi:hypothetical protein